MGRSWLRLRMRSLRPLVPHFPARGVVVDLGAGHGALLALLQARQPTQPLVAVEHDPRRAAWLRRRFAEMPVTVQEDDMTSCALPPCQGLALLDVLHYFTREDQDALLSRAARVLEPGGVLVLRVPDPEAGWRFTWNRMHERVATHTGFTQARVVDYRTLASFANHLEGLGMQVAVGPKASGFYADRWVRATKPEAREA